MKSVSFPVSRLNPLSEIISEEAEVPAESVKMAIAAIVVAGRNPLLMRLERGVDMVCSRHCSGVLRRDSVVFETDACEAGA